MLVVESRAKKRSHARTEGGPAASTMRINQTGCAYRGRIPRKHRSKERKRVSVSRLRFPFLLAILRRSGLANARNAAMFRGRRASCGRAVVRSCGRVRASVSEDFCESPRVVYNHNQIDRRKAPISIATCDLDEDSEIRPWQRGNGARARAALLLLTATTPPFLRRRLERSCSKKRKRRLQTRFRQKPGVPCFYARTQRPRSTMHHPASLQPSG